MRRLAPLALALGLAVFVGAAHADTFAVVPTTPAPTPFVAPAALSPNAGSRMKG